MVIFLCRYIVKDGKRDEFMQKLVQNNIPMLCQNEDGCLQYEYFYPVDKANQIVIIEKWEEEKYQIAHTQTAHVGVLKQLKQIYVDETILEKHEVQ